METKPWYLSKGIWAGIIAVLVVTYNAFKLQLIPGLPEIPEWFLGLLASLGLYARATATSTITK